jgi:hypothetical protein
LVTRRIWALDGEGSGACGAAMAVTELGRLSGFRVGAAGSLVIAIFKDTATVERLHLLDRVQTEFARQHPKLYTLNVVVGASIKSPEAEVREVSAALQAKFNDTTAASATVLAVKGLGAVIARGFLAGLALASGGSTPTKVFKTVPEATTWLQGLPGVPIDLMTRRDLAAEIEAFMNANDY